MYHISHDNRIKTGKEIKQQIRGRLDSSLIRRPRNLTVLIREVLSIIILCKQSVQKRCFPFVVITENVIYLMHYQYSLIFVHFVLVTTRSGICNTNKT